MLAAFAIWFAGESADRRELQVELRHVKERLTELAMRSGAIEVRLGALERTGRNTP